MSATFNQLMENGKVFTAVVDNVMKRSTYNALWKRFFSWVYTPTLTFQSYLANSKASAAASVISWASGKPIRTRPTVGQLTGTLGQLGDQYQMDAQVERQMLELEERIRRGEANVDALYEFISNDIEKLVIAPQKRLDMWAYGGMSTGKITVDSTNNPDGVQFEIDLQIPAYETKGAPWAIGTTTSTPLTDIRNVLDTMKASGYIVSTMMMSRATFNKMISSSEFKNVFKLEFGRLKVDTVNVVTPNMVNTYLAGVGLPAIEVVEDVVALPDGTQVYPFADDVVVFSVGTTIGEMQYTYSIEQRNPRPHKVYSNYDNVMLATWLNDKGRFSENELNAFPAFTNYKRMARLDTSTQES